MVAGRAGAAVTGGAVLKAASAGAARRLVQTVVMFVVLTAATTAALVGLALATYPARAFQAVSARYHIADLAVTIDATKVTSAQLARTRHLPGVTRAAGYPATTVSITIPATPGYRGGAPVSGPLTLVGRASRSGPLDHITQKSGRWPARPGEIDQNDLSGTRGSVGQLTTITVTNVRGPAEARHRRMGLAARAGRYAECLDRARRDHRPGTGRRTQAGTDALHLPPRIHRRPGQRGPGRTAGGAARRGDHRLRHRAGLGQPERHGPRDPCVVRHPVRPHGPAARGGDRRGRRRGRGDGRLPPDRRAEEHRLHPGADRRHLSHPARDSGPGRVAGRDGARPPVGAAPAPGKVAVQGRRDHPRLDRYRGAGRDAGADRAGGPGARRAGGAAPDRAGDHRRAGPTGRARARRPPDRWPAAAAPPGHRRAGRPVHPPRPVGRHPGHHHHRADRGRPRRGPGRPDHQDRAHHRRRLS